MAQEEQRGLAGPMAPKDWEPTDDKCIASDWSTQIPVALAWFSCMTARRPKRSVAKSGSRHSLCVGDTPSAKAAKATTYYGRVRVPSEMF
jgi:hypothetical protein